jgi:hypothetical protein
LLRFAFIVLKRLSRSSEAAQPRSTKDLDSTALEQARVRLNSLSQKDLRSTKRSAG